MRCRGYWRNGQYVRDHWFALLLTSWQLEQLLPWLLIMVIYRLRGEAGKCRASTVDQRPNGGWT